MKQIQKSFVRSSRLFFISLILLLSACASQPPANKSNLCTIFKEKPAWHKASLKAAKKWNGSVPVAMAIMYQESSFEAKAKPSMRYFLGFIPYGRPSDAYGYAQALDNTWSEYKREAGSMLSQRDSFADASDFIQWYMHKTWRVNRISKTDAYKQYLNYHEGQGGFSRGSYRSKGWLINVAKKVDARARRYAAQYQSCSIRK